MSEASKAFDRSYPYFFNSKRVDKCSNALFVLNTTKNKPATGTKIENRISEFRLLLSINLCAYKVLINTIDKKIIKTLSSTAI